MHSHLIKFKSGLISLFICMYSGGAFAGAALAVTDPVDQIKTLENKYFERTFDKDSETARLDRLESFIFGSTNSGSLQTRLDSIEAVVSANSPPQKPQVSQESSQQTRVPESEEPDLPGDYPRVTQLEQDLLVQTYENDGLRKRLSRLENTVFGAPDRGELSDRVDRLEKYDLEHNAQAKKRAMAKRQAEQGYQEIPRTSSNPLLNFGASGSFAPQAATPAAYSYQENPAQMARERALQEQITDANRPEPPSPQERTLSRVAWCEKQMFSQTYPQMHLIQRLRQLNDNLFPGDKESDMQLMDRIDIIVKTVVLRKHP